MTGAAPPGTRFSRILMTGGTGFVGGHLCPRLVANYPDAQRLILTRAGDPAHRPGFALQSTDLTNRAEVRSAVEAFRPDLVLHLAAQAAITEASAAREDTWRLNVEGALNLASALSRSAPHATVLFVSSAEVYGRSFKDGPASEDTPTYPTNAYARSKLAAELALADVLPPDAALIVARAFNHTGPGQDTRFALPAFAAQIAKIEAGQTPPRLMVGNLEAERDFLDVRDVCDAYLALLAVAAPGSRETVNVSSGQVHRIGDLLEELRRLATTPFEIVSDPKRMRPSDIPCSVGRRDKLVRMTGWSPRIPIASTLRDVLEGQRQLLAKQPAL